jgi:hypothetical protein
MYPDFLIAMKREGSVCIIQSLAKRTEQRILNAAREKCHVSFKGKPIRIMLRHFNRNPIYLEILK